MKWVALTFFVGITELWSTSLLHEILGTTKLIQLYVLTTVVGMLFLGFRLSEFKKAMESVEKFRKNQKGKKMGMQHWSTEQFKPILKPMAFCIIYVCSSILIAVPGIVTDVIGVLLILPITTNYLTRKVEAVTR